jgi:hypothetical protein
MVTMSGTRITVRIEHRGTAAWIRSAPVVLTSLLALDTLAAAAASLLVRDALRGPEAMIGSLQGTALVLLIVTLPILVVSAVAAGRGSAVAIVGWLGALGSIAYQAVLLLFATPFNAFFFLYVAMLSLAVWALIALWTRIDVADLAARVGRHAPVRFVAGYLVANAALFGLLWLRATVPAVLSADPPAFLEGTGMTTGPVQILDFAFTLPLLAIAAVQLWRRRPIGFVLAGAILVMLAIESASVGVDQWLGHLADPASPAVSDALTPIFAALTLIGVVVLALFLRPGPVRPIKTSR